MSQYFEFRDSLPARLLHSLHFSVSLFGGTEDLASDMKARLPKVLAAKDAGIIGEGTDGFLHPRDGISVETQALVDAENNDRKALFHALSAKTGGSVEEVVLKFSNALAKKAKKGIGSRNRTALGSKSKVCNFQSRFLRERIGGFGFMRLTSSPFLAKRRTQSGIRFPTWTAGGSGREKNRLPETGEKTCLGIGLAEVENPCRASRHLPNEPSEVSGKCSRSGNGPVRFP